MTRSARSFAAVLAVVGLVAASGFASAPPDDKGQDRKGQTIGGPSHGKKQHTDYSGEALLGDNITKNGAHKLQDHGRYSVSVNVSHGEITGVRVKHADQGSVPVKKYKTAKNMAQGTTKGAQPASYHRAQSESLDAMWIGYGYVDEWGDDYNYWFPYAMIHDGDAGAVEYYPAYE